MLCSCMTTARCTRSSSSGLQTSRPPGRSQIIWMRLLCRRGRSPRKCRLPPVSTLACTLLPTSGAPMICGQRWGEGDVGAAGVLQRGNALPAAPFPFSLPPSTPPPSARLQQARVRVEAVHGQAVHPRRVNCVPPPQVQRAARHRRRRQRQQPRGRHHVAAVNKQLLAGGRGGAGAAGDEGWRVGWPPVGATASRLVPHSQRAKAKPPQQQAVASRRGAHLAGADQAAPQAVAGRRRAHSHHCVAVVLPERGQLQAQHAVHCARRLRVSKGAQCRQLIKSRQMHRQAAWLH